MLRLAYQLIRSQSHVQLCCVGRAPPAKSSTVEPIASHSFPLKSALSRCSVNPVQSVDSLEVMLRLVCRLISQLCVQLFYARRVPPVRLLMAEPPVFQKFQNAGGSVHPVQFASSSMGLLSVFIDKPRLGMLSNVC